MSEEIFILPSLASRRGAARLQVVAGIIGKEQALAAAQKAGPYLLDDTLADGLRLRGLELPFNDELKTLSPKNWKLGVAELPAGAEVVSLALTQSQEKSLRKLAPDASKPAELLYIAERLFYEESLKLLIRYTAPRFHRS